MLSLKNIVGPSHFGLIMMIKQVLERYDFCCF